MAYTPFNANQPKSYAELMQLLNQRAQPTGLNTQTPGYFGNQNPNQWSMPVGTNQPNQQTGILPNPNANATPKNQKAAIIMGALSDIFRGQDTTQNTVLRQQQMVAMDAQRKAQERFDAAYANANPQMQKIMGNYTPEQWTQIQGELDIARLKPTEMKPPTSYQEYALTDSTPTNNEYTTFLKNKTRQGATQINLPNLQAQSNIDYAYKVLEQGDQRLIDNQSVTDRLYLMDSILDNPEFETGAMTEALLPIRSWLIEFGGKDQIYVDNLGDQQLFNALSSYIVPRMRAVGSGATSDFEAKLYQSAVASLGKTPEANRMIVKFMLATTERDRKMLELQKRYVAENQEVLGLNAALNNPDSGYVEPELFRKFDMKEESGITDFDQAVANGDIKEGDLYYDRKAKKMRIYGSEPIPDPF
tara:strand:- start:3265 stop:4515 length:1251 start_codon:yes stop_codon:yes gene_type:complete